MSALKNWEEEKRSAYLYQALSSMEPNPIHRKLFTELSAMAEKQANIWEIQLKKENIIIPKKYRPDLRVRFVIKLVQCFGVRALRIALTAMKIRGMSIYQAPRLGNQTAGELEYKHRGINSSNTLRAGAFGMSDGLISNVCLILGIAGAQANYHFILLSGIAGLFAGACSMGAGEYISVRSQREMLEYQLELEKSELDLYPEEEASELSLIYQARGLPKEDAERISHLLIQNPDRALDTLAREELGINPNELVSPWSATVSSFFSFSLGAFIPLIPYIVSNSSSNLLYTIYLTGIALFCTGAFLSLFTQRSAISGGIRLLLIGAATGCLTYFIGNWIGVTVH
jgi:VIT1/CCC1 family predicted Fe2+/Mn2+ transporter